MFRYILLCCLLIGGLLSPATAQTNKKIRSLQREQSSLKKDIANQEQLLKSTKKDVNTQLSNLQVLGAQIEGQQKYVNGIHTEIKTLSSDINQLEKQLAALERDLTDCKRKYQRAVTYMFRNRMRFSQWQFILSAHSFRQMYRRMRYVTEFSRYQQAQGRVIQKKEAVIEAKRQQLLSAKAEKDRLYTEGKEQTAKLEGQQKERQQVVDELNKKQKQLNASLNKQRKKYAQLNARIDKLIQEEIAAAERRRKAEAERRRKAELARQRKLRQQREQAATRRKQTASSSKNKSSRKGKNNYDAEETATPDFTVSHDVDRALSGSFAANRGRLPMPITGSYAITTHFGQYNVPGLRGVQLDNKGINITGRPGAQARSVFRGEVTAIFAYSGMYNIIVRHGSYMTVYCNLASTSVRRGQEVSARQVLGSVAKDASGNCTLHFQLRKETTKLNPESWLAR